MGGINPYTDTTVPHNLNVSKILIIIHTIISNINLIKHNLIIPKHNAQTTLLSHTLGSIYYNTTEKMYEGFSHEGWQPLGGFSKNKVSL